MLSSPFDELVLLLHVADECLTKAIANYRPVELEQSELREIRDAVRFFRHQYSDQPRRLSSKQIRSLLSLRNDSQTNPRGLDGAALALTLALQVIGAEDCERCTAMRFCLSQAIIALESLS